MENANNRTVGATDGVFVDCFNDEQRARFKVICDGITSVLRKHGGIMSGCKEIQDAAYGVMFAGCIYSDKRYNVAAKVADLVLPLVNIDGMHQYIVDVCKLAREVMTPDAIYTKYMIPSILDNYAREVVKQMIANEKQLTQAGRETLYEVINIKGYSYNIYNQVQRGNRKQVEMFENARKHVGSFTKYLFRTFGSFVNSKLSFA